MLQSIISNLLATSSKQITNNTKKKTHT